MYEERKEKFSFKNFFLTILLVLLFIFLMLWLFPNKNYIDNKLQSTYDIEKLSVLYDEVFANNVSRMKDAAIGYFTNERMPKTVGESKKLTLKEMYDLHLVLKMKDKNGKECDSKKSYVEMTKYSEEYQLKVNLSCGTYEDYIIVYLGCYNYCKEGICERRVSTSSKKSESETKTDQKEYKYEYKLEVEEKTTCPVDWSNWQKEEIKSTDLLKVETKQVSEIINYKTEEVPITKTEVVKKQVTEKYIKDYITQLVVKETKKVPDGTTTQTITEKVVVGSVEVASDRYGYGTKVPQNTETVHYKKISENTINKPCSTCESTTIYYWQELDVEPVYKVVEKKVEIPVYKTVNVYESKDVPIYDYRTVEKEEEVTKTVIETKQTPVYGNVTYYRYKNCTVRKGYTDTKWSNSKSDKDLLNKGYKLTGNVKEA